MSTALLDPSLAVLVLSLARRACKFACCRRGKQPWLAARERDQSLKSQSQIWLNKLARSMLEFSSSSSQETAESKWPTSPAGALTVADHGLKSKCQAVVYAHVSRRGMHADVPQQQLWLSQHTHSAWALCYAIQQLQACASRKCKQYQLCYLQQPCAAAAPQGIRPALCC
jgi:hypothetical protein